MTLVTQPRPSPRRRTRRTGALDRLLGRATSLLERPEAPYLVLLGGFLAVGLFLRLDRLGAHSLWFDEADAVLLAKQPLTTLIGNLAAAGQNGPLYTLFMHGWIALFGTGEAAVRLPSALAGALAIPLIYALGRALHGPKLGLYAAGILTIAPYQHWYAQEAKMYAPLVGAVLAATLLLVHADRTDRPRWWLAYVVVTTLTLYLHVMAVLIVAAHALWNVTRGVTSGREQSQQPTIAGRRVPRAAFAFAALTLPYLPIALWELRFIGGGTVTWHRPIGPLDFLRVTFTKFATGIRADDGTAARGLILFGALALLGALPLAWRHGPWPAPTLAPRRRSMLLAGAVIVPTTLFYAVTLLRPLFADRYLIVVTPALILLVAGGLLALERFAWPLAPVAIALLLATSWVSLRDVNLATTAQKEDWRAAYAEIAAHRHPNDVIIVHPGYLDTTLDYYALRDPRLADLPRLSIPTATIDGTAEPRALDLYLQRASAGYERVWLILSPDRVAQLDPLDRTGDCERDRARDWFCYNAHPLAVREFNGIWLGLYAYNGPFGTAFFPPPAVRLDLPTGPDLTLVGYSYDFPPSASEVRRGEPLPLLLHWIYRTLDSGRFAIRWGLLDEKGNAVPEVGATAALLGDRPPRRWEGQRGNYFWDYHDLALPTTLPAGRYRLVIRVAAAARPDTPLGPDTIPLGWFTLR